MKVPAPAGGVGAANALPLRLTVRAYVGLGANLGDPVAALHAALHGLAQMPGVAAVHSSSFFRSAPVDAGGPWYVNAVARVDTTLTAPALLAALQALERAAGRERPYRNAPRTLDLDVLLYGAGRIDSPALTVPHPRLWSRAFVLHPLHELAPELVAPEALASVADQAIDRFSPSA